MFFLKEKEVYEEIGLCDGNLGYADVINRLA